MRTENDRDDVPRGARIYDASTEVRLEQFAHPGYERRLGTDCWAKSESTTTKSATIVVQYHNSHMQETKSPIERSHWEEPK